MNSNIATFLSNDTKLLDGDTLKSYTGKDLKSETSEVKTISLKGPAIVGFNCNKSYGINALATILDANDFSNEPNIMISSDHQESFDVTIDRVGYFTLCGDGEPTSTGQLNNGIYTALFIEDNENIIIECTNISSIENVSSTPARNFLTSAVLYTLEYGF